MSYFGSSNGVMGPGKRITTSPFITKTMKLDVTNSSGHVVTAVYIQLVSGFGTLHTPSQETVAVSLTLVACGREGDEPTQQHMARRGPFMGMSI